MSKRHLKWSSKAWDEYVEWQTENPRALKKINNLIKDILRTPTNGFGKAEALRGHLSGFYSRRITDEHRIVYAIDEEGIIVISCKSHYEN